MRGKYKIAYTPPGGGGEERERGRAVVSHFLAQRCNVAGGFNDALTPVVVFVEFITEAFKHGHERRGVCGHFSFLSWLIVRV